MVIEMDLIPPRWADVQEEVSDLLADIAQKSAQLDKLHQKHLLPGFGDEDVRRKDEGAIERLTQDVTRSFHDCQRSIQRIESMVRDSKQQGAVSNGEETMAKNIQISLAARVQESSARFRKKQSTYLRSMYLPSRPWWLATLDFGFGLRRTTRLIACVLNRTSRYRRFHDTVRCRPDCCSESLHRPIIDGV